MKLIPLPTYESGMPDGVEWVNPEHITSLVPLRRTCSVHLRCGRSVHVNLSAGECARRINIIGETLPAHEHLEHCPAHPGNATCICEPGMERV